MTPNNHQPLGQTLKQAGLISDFQIETVLAERQYTQHLRVGEIMAMRGWIAPQTADFFAEEWSDLVVQVEKKPLGYYLQKAGLLSEQQTKYILEEQKKIWVKFGSVAVLQGIIEQQTIDFFLSNLFPLEALDSSLIGKRDSETASNLELENESLADTLEEESHSVEIDDDDIPWID